MKLPPVEKPSSKAKTLLATELMLAEEALSCHRIERDEDTVFKNDVSHRILSQLRKLMPELKKRLTAAFIVERTRDGLARVRYADDAIRTLVSIAAADHLQLARGYPCYTFFPVYRELLKLVRVAQAGRFAFDSYLNCTFSIEDATEIAEFANRLVQIFIKDIRRPLVKHAQENFERSANDNFQGLLKNLTAIAERHPSVVVLRFETFYDPPAGVPRTPTDQSELGHLHELMAHRTRLHAWLRKRFKRDLLLYAWTLEHGPHRGLHHHYLVVLKATKDNQDHVNVVDAIDAKWSRITNGLGSLYNGNEHRSKQRYQALGLVHMTDPSAVTGLQLIAAYLTLANVYVKLHVDGKFDSFGKGGIMGGSDPSVYQKSGRPAKRRLPIPIAISAAEGRARVNFM